MEIVLIGLGIFAVILALTIAFSMDKIFSAVCIVIGCFAVVVCFGSTRGVPAYLGKGATYTFIDEYSSNNTTQEKILELRTNGWGASYFYQVSCPQLRDGCPKKWPGQFMVIRDSDKLVIVPLSGNDTNNK